MYINFWYPVCLSKELEDKPLKQKILGLEFVAFRDKAGNAHCLSNTCVHRGGSLGNGKCVPETTLSPVHIMAGSMGETVNV